MLFKTAKKLSPFLLVAFILLIGQGIMAQSWFDWTDGPEEVTEDKVWVVTFDQPLLEDSVDQDSVYVLDEETGEEHPVKIELMDEDTVVSVTPEEPYERGQTYELYISTDVQNQNEVPLEEGVKKSFYIPGVYEVAKISSLEDYETVGKYEDFETALNEVERDGSEVILFADSILWATDGIVHTQGYTVIHESPELDDAKTYINTVSNGMIELEYIDTLEDSIEIKLAGETGYISHDDGSIIPDDYIEERSYYEVVEGSDENRLVHHVYEDNYRNYDYGWAPSSLEPGEYYSWDGITFEGETLELFNQLDITKDTNYTAEDIDDYIDEFSKVRDTEGNAPLAGLGEAFIEAQEEYQVNALFLMSLAIHESAWGGSKIAQEKNNLFGLNATDSDPYGNADEFESFEEAVLYAGYFINKGYLDPDDWRYNGPYAGNKTLGLNVRYASDPYWGQKVAGHMYTADSHLGEKDRELLDHYEPENVKHDSMEATSQDDDQSQDEGTTDDSTNDDSSTDDSTNDDSTNDDSTNDDSSTDDSTNDDSTTDDSSTDDSTTDDSSTDDTTNDDSTNDDSTTDDTSTDDSTTDDSTTDDTSTDDSTTDDSSTDTSNE
ncbi:glucosaminidase domain-containing protein [Alkalibacillus aidingensis]|uniref:glucosaminidase domain-containing protein n=1 Tax=Alkalibacillus aidingensis TaxID=2747607 RepID=UPI0016607482|nr:glucosaminidase domain-containing protein [Alkalibacillus aidingensis]